MIEDKNEVIEVREPVRKMIPILYLAFGLLLFAGGAFAQNKTYSSDSASAVTKTGVVTDLVWANPRCIVSMDVKGDNGGIVNLSIELTNPRTLIRFGVIPATLPEGKEVTVTFSPSTSEANRGLIKELKIDGKVVFDMEKAIADGGVFPSSRDANFLVQNASAK
jgi:hypothetical protein